MRKLKKLTIIVVIGLVFGVWFGMNMANHRPLLSNPFGKESLQDKIIRSSGEALEKGGRALKGQAGP